MSRVLRFIYSGNGSLGEDINRKRFIFFYTLFFSIVAFLVLIWFIPSHRTFIWHHDGWWQHYKILVYYSDYLKEIIRNFTENHKLIIPQWDYNLGEGGDVLQMLHYHVIGDPFNAFCFLFPREHMYIYYDFAILARLYLAGLFFLLFCLRKGHKNAVAIMAGSITYVFCYWGLVNIARHPFFLNPMVFLPAILIGLEDVLENKLTKAHRYVIAIFFAAMANFYFFYMIVLLVIIYVAVRMFDVYGFRINLWVKPIGKIFAFSLLGTPDAFCRLQAFLSCTAAGGVFVIKVKERSA